MLTDNQRDNIFRRTESRFISKMSERNNCLLSEALEEYFSSPYIEQAIRKHIALIDENDEKTEDVFIEDLLSSLERK